MAIARIEEFIASVKDLAIFATSLFFRFMMVLM